MDDVLRDALQALDAAFTETLVSCYVVGSYADGSSLETSDLDLTLVVRRSLDEDAAQNLMAHLREMCPVELDVEILTEAELPSGITPELKLAGRLIYGEDIRGSAPLIPIEEWTRDRMHAAYYLLVKVFDRPPIVRLPLDYPDPSGELFGYDNRLVQLPSGATAKSTRNIIRVAGWIGTALLALQAGQYVARKADCHVLYREHIGDEWTALLEDIYEWCRGEWRYLIPKASGDRDRLRFLCRRMLMFENHFLAVYRGYLLAELRSPVDAARGRAVWLMQQIPFDDEEIRPEFAAAAAQKLPSI